MIPYSQENHQFSYPDYRFMPCRYYYSSYPEGAWHWNNGALEWGERYHLPAEQRLAFVLVHGSWADAHFWDGVAAELRSRGHTVYTLEYAGHGEDPNKDVTHAMITKSVVDFITKLNLRNFVLVGHSLGGTVIQKVAEQT